MTEYTETQLSEQAGSLAAYMRRAHNCAIVWRKGLATFPILSWWHGPGHYSVTHRGLFPDDIIEYVTRWNTLDHLSFMKLNYHAREQTLSDTDMARYLRPYVYMGLAIRMPQASYAQKHTLFPPKK